MIAAVASLSTGDLLRAVTPGLASDLACAAAVERLIAAGDRLPLTSGGGFECHLGNANRVDLAVRFLPREAGTESLSQGISSDQTVNSDIRRLLRDWMVQKKKPIHPPLNFWLEYDLKIEGPTSPSVFLGPGNSLGSDPHRLDLSTWERLIHSLALDRSDTYLISEFHDLCRSLPPNAWIGYVGKMAGAAAHQLRVTVSGILPGQIAPLLRAVRWPGENIAKATQTADIAGARTTLSIDLGRNRQARLGLELALAPDGDWHGMLSRLLPAADCDPNLIPALLAWPGITCCGDEHWPPSLRLAVWGIVRRLNHLKIVYRGTEPPQVKAYLYYGMIEKS